jgi:signal peptidase II
MRVLWIAAVILAIDQATKAAVLNLMYRGQSIPVLGDWLKLTFTENPGMAFGLEVGPPGTVTILSIIATILVGYYIYQVRHGYPPYLASLALVLGGALGNIIDRVFYGALLDYGTLFTGHVVDFIHVSVWRGFIPEGIPVLGGTYLELFPIWNVADMAIVVGVVGVLLFHRVFHEQLIAHHRQQAERASDAPPVVDAPAGNAAADDSAAGEAAAADAGSAADADNAAATIRQLANDMPDPDQTMDGNGEDAVSSDVDDAERRSDR